MRTNILLITAISAFFLFGAASASAITCPAGAPDVPFDSAFNGVWRGKLPKECSIKKSKKKKGKKKGKRVSTLKICIKDNANGTNREFTGSVRNGVNLMILQEDATIKPIGPRLNFQCGVPYDSDDPAQKAFTELRGTKGYSSRTANMAIEIADEKDAATADPGDLVATMGNCVGIVYKYVKANSDCP